MRVATAFDYLVPHGIILSFLEYRIRMHILSYKDMKIFLDNDE